MLNEGLDGLNNFEISAAGTLTKEANGNCTADKIHKKISGRVFESPLREAAPGAAG